MTTLTTSKHLIFFRIIALVAFILFTVCGLQLAVACSVSFQNQPTNLGSEYSPDSFCQPKKDGVSFFTGSMEKIIGNNNFIYLPVFVYVYAGYKPDCRRMQNNVFDKKEVGEFFNKNFLNVKINLHSVDGFKLYNDYSLKNFPAYLFLNRFGEVIDQSYGYIEATEFLKFGKQALYKFQSQDNTHFIQVSQPIEGDEVSNNFDQQFKSLIEYNILYENGYTEKDFLYNYAYLLKKFNQPNQHIADQYVSQLLHSEFSMSKNIQFIFDFSDNTQTNAFQVLLKNYNYYIKFLDEERINLRIKESVKMSVILAAMNRNVKEMEQALSYLKLVNFRDSEEYKFCMRATFYEKTGNWREFSTLVLDYFKNPNSIDPQLLDMFSRKFAVNSINELKLEKALIWSKGLVNEYPTNYKYRETYAALLYRLNKTTKALKEAETAKLLAQKHGLDYSSTLYLIETILSNKKLTQQFVED